MASITIRNIPEYVFRKIKKLSEIEKRSMNNEFLVIIERGLEGELMEKVSRGVRIHPSSQARFWRNLSAVWEDERTTEEIIKDIYANRTLGRETTL